MKKIVSVIISIVLTMGLLTGCKVSEKQVAGSESTTAAEAAGAPEIGVVFYSNTDSLGSAVESLCNQAATVYGLPNIRWEIGALDNDTQINQIQNLISAGVKGIMIIPLSDAVSQKCGQMCKEAGVYFSFCFRTVNDEAIRKEVTSNPYFVGMCNEDDMGAAKHLVEIHANNGRKNLGLIYAQISSAVGVSRNTGFDQGVEEFGINKLADFAIPGGGDVNTTQANTQNFLTSYADMDCIVAGASSSGNGETIAQVIASSGKDVQFTCFDTFEGMEDAFESGILAGAAGGMAPDALYSFGLLYNACMGNSVSETYAELSQPYLFVENMDDFKMYNEYIVNPDGILKLYTDEYIRSLSKENNQELTAESMQDMMDSYTFGWIRESIK